MLKQRVITAALLAPVVLACVFLLPLEYFSLFFAFVTLLGAWEWAALAGLRNVVTKALFTSGVFLALAVAQQLFSADSSVTVLLPAALVWGVAFIWVYRYPTPGAWQSTAIRALIGLLLLSAAWLSMVELKALNAGNSWILLVLLVVWAADIGAYFSGKRWGSRKLAPNVSPKKTWEGVFGGLLAAALTAAGFAYWNELSLLNLVLLTLLCIVVGLVSVMGDLFESLLKRHAGLKDSGRILPGHGGVLDRIDSILAAVPFFYIGLSALSLA